MNRYVRFVVAVAAIATYLVALRYVAPSDQPYFILGIGLAGLVAWLLGTVAGLVAALLLIPLTNHVYGQFTVSTSYLSFASSPAYLGVQILAAVTLGRLRREKIILKEKEAELAETNQQLQAVLSSVQELGGIHNMCSECSSIQNDVGQWQSIGVYLKEQTKMEFSHCICPACAKHFHKHVTAGPSD